MGKAKTKINLSNVQTNKKGNYLWKNSIGKTISLKRKKETKTFNIVRVTDKQVVLLDERHNTYFVTPKYLKNGDGTKLWDTSYEKEVKPCKDGYTNLNVVPKRPDGKYDWCAAEGQAIPYEYKGMKREFVIIGRKGSVLTLEDSGVSRKCYETEVGRGQLTRFYKKVAENT